MKRQINRFLKLIWILRNLHTPIWLMVNNRWYVYKDSPDLFVRYIAQIKYEGSKDVDNMVKLAKQEVETRRVKKRYDTTN